MAGVNSARSPEETGSRCDSKPAVVSRGAGSRSRRSPRPSRPPRRPRSRRSPRPLRSGRSCAGAGSATGSDSKLAAGSTTGSAGAEAAADDFDFDPSPSSQFQLASRSQYESWGELPVAGLGWGVRAEESAASNDGGGLPPGALSDTAVAGRSPAASLSSNNSASRAFRGADADDSPAVAPRGFSRAAVGRSVSARSGTGRVGVS